MSHFAVLLALCFIVLPIQTVFAGTDEFTARVVVRVYVLNNPLYLAEMEALVTQNRNLFAANSPVIRCMQYLGVKLTQAGIKAIDPRALERATDLASRSGAPPALIPGVAEKMNSGAGQLIVLGQQFVWLTEVLPVAAQGNWVPFVRTAPLGGISHQQAVQVLNQLPRDLLQLTKAIINQNMPFIGR